MLTGQQGFLYYLSSGTAGVAGTRATWTASATSGIYIAAPPSNLTLISGVVDLDIAWEKIEADSSARDSDDETVVTALRKHPITFGLRYKLDQVELGQLLLLQTFAQTGIYIPLLALDRASTVSGAYGLWADFEVTGMKKGEKLKDVQMFDVTVKPSGRSSVRPQIVRIS